MYKYQKPVNILKVSTQLANLIQQKVDVLLLSGRIGKHTPEEIDFGSQRLIANQNRALFHHPAFDPRSNLQRNILKIIIGSMNTSTNRQKRSQMQTKKTNRYQKNTGSNMTQISNTKTTMQPPNHNSH